jgi:hypothetical protein
MDYKMVGFPRHKGKENVLQQFISEISSDLLPRAAASKCLMGLANVSIWAVQLSAKKRERER